jgi:hypothetical protein
VWKWRRRCGPDVATAKCVLQKKVASSGEATVTPSNTLA